jgi:hypothetical protein
LISDVVDLRPLAIDIEHITTILRMFHANPEDADKRKIA